MSDPKTSVGIFELGVLHRTLVEAYKKANDAFTKASKAYHDASDLKTSLYVSLRQLENHIEDIEKTYGINSTKFITIEQDEEQQEHA